MTAAAPGPADNGGARKMVERLRTEANASEELPSRKGDSDIETMREPADMIEALALSVAAANAYASSCAAALCPQAALPGEVDQMREALIEAEACMSIVEPRSDKAEYLRILGVVRAALSRAPSADTGDGR